MTPQNLISFRRKFNLTQAECAGALHCSHKSISNWETGVHAIPGSIGLAASAFANCLPQYGGIERKK